MEAIEKQIYYWDERDQPTKYLFWDYYLGDAGAYHVDKLDVIFESHTDLVQAYLVFSKGMREQTEPDPWWTFEEANISKGILQDIDRADKASPSAGFAVASRAPRSVTEEDEGREVASDWDIAIRALGSDGVDNLLVAAQACSTQIHAWIEENKLQYSDFRLSLSIIRGAFRIVDSRYSPSPLRILPDATTERAYRADLIAVKKNYGLGDSDPLLKNLREETPFTLAWDEMVRLIRKVEVAHPA